MPSPTYKILIFLKRRPGMSFDAFRDYYEGVHAKLCAPLMAGASRYFRRYLEPLPDGAAGETRELEYDVITELWYDDRALFERTAKYAPRGLLPPEIVADEERLFDRSKTRFASVVELESEGFGAARGVG